MSFSLDESVALLERTPAVFDAWLRGLPNAWVASNEGPSTWSAVEIVEHLIHGELTDWIPRTKQILRGGDAATFTPFDPAGYQEASDPRSIDDLLSRFADLRAKGLAELRALNLGPTELALCGVHPEFGPVRLDQLLSAWTAHDLAHMAQTARAMARYYQTAVGPWSQYLSIVEPR